MGKGEKEALHYYHKKGTLKTNKMRVGNQKYVS